MTSESSRDSTRAGAARRASCPPLMREMCLRTALISWMVAPQASSSRVVACFSSSVMPSAGRGRSADAPPEIRQITRSSRPAAGGDLRRCARAGDAALVGDRVAALVQFDAAQFGEVAVLDVDQAGGDAAAEDALGGLRHGGSGLACADDVDVAEAVEVAPREVAGDGVGGIGGGEGGAEDGQGVHGGGCVGGHWNRGWVRMAATVISGSSLSMGMWTSARR